ncbi:MAG: hypothetical protein K2V38_09985 [Gemmataceae bacterium]|nr:hypothetical protein [Gemmataceae bacterium]
MTKSQKAMADAEAQVQHFGFQNPANVLKLVGLFGPPVLDLVQKFADDGFSIGFVEELFDKMEPPIIKFMTDWFSKEDGGSGVMAAVEQMTDLDPNDPCLGLPLSGTQASALAVVAESPAAAAQAQASSALVAFFLRKYLFSRLPDFVRDKLAGKEEEVVQFVLTMLLGL